VPKINRYDLCRSAVLNGAGQGIAVSADNLWLVIKQGAVEVAHGAWAVSLVAINILLSGSLACCW